MPDPRFEPTANEGAPAPSGDAIPPRGGLDVPEWVSELRRLYVEPKTRAELRRKGVIGSQKRRRGAAATERASRASDEAVPPVDAAAAPQSVGATGTPAPAPASAVAAASAGSPASSSGPSPDGDAQGATRLSPSLVAAGGGQAEDSADPRSEPGQAAADSSPRPTAAGDQPGPVAAADLSDPAVVVGPSGHAPGEDLSGLAADAGLPTAPSAGFPSAADADLPGPASGADPSGSAVEGVSHGRSLAELASESEREPAADVQQGDAPGAPDDLAATDPVSGPEPAAAARRSGSVPPVTLSWREAESLELGVPDVDGSDGSIVVEPPSQLVAERRNRRREPDADDVDEVDEVESGLESGPPAEEPASVPPEQDHVPPTRASLRAASGYRSGKRRRAFVIGFVLVLLAIVAWYFLLRGDASAASAAPVASAAVVLVRWPVRWSRRPSERGAHDVRGRGPSAS